MTPEQVDPRRRSLIIVSTVLASMVFAVDVSIANVALPQMQASMSASSEQIIWVVTSYLIASAIATPLSSWLASRFGRKPLLLISVGGFTLASVACGLANDLTTAVIARGFQGITGAGKAFSEANMVAYVDAYWLIFMLALAILPVVMLMRPPEPAS